MKDTSISASMNTCNESIGDDLPGASQMMPLYGVVGDSLDGADSNWDASGVDGRRNNVVSRLLSRATLLDSNDIAVSSCEDNVNMNTSNEKSLFERVVAGTSSGKSIEHYGITNDAKERCSSAEIEDNCMTSGRVFNNGSGILSSVAPTPLLIPIGICGDSTPSHSKSIENCDNVNDRGAIVDDPIETSHLKNKSDLSSVCAADSPPPYFASQSLFISPDNINGKASHVTTTVQLEELEKYNNSILDQVIESKEEIGIDISIGSNIVDSNGAIVNMKENYVCDRTDSFCSVPQYEPTQEAALSVLLPIPKVQSITANATKCAVNSSVNAVATPATLKGEESIKRESAVLSLTNNISGVRSAQKFDVQDTITSPHSSISGVSVDPTTVPPTLPDDESHFNCNISSSELDIPTQTPSLLESGARNSRVLCQSQESSEALQEEDKIRRVEDVSESVIWGPSFEKAVKFDGYLSDDDYVSIEKNENASALEAPAQILPSKSESPSQFDYTQESLRPMPEGFTLRVPRVTCSGNEVVKASFEISQSPSMSTNKNTQAVDEFRYSKPDDISDNEDGYLPLDERMRKRALDIECGRDGHEIGYATLDPLNDDNNCDDGDDGTVPGNVTITATKIIASTAAAVPNGKSTSLQDDHSCDVYGCEANRTSEPLSTLSCRSCICCKENKTSESNAEKDFLEPPEAKSVRDELSSSCPVVDPDSIVDPDPIVDPEVSFHECVPETPSAHLIDDAVSTDRKAVHSTPIIVESTPSTVPSKKMKKQVVRRRITRTVTTTTHRTTRTQTFVPMSSIRPLHSDTNTYTSEPTVVTETTETLLPLKVKEKPNDNVLLKETSHMPSKYYVNEKRIPLPPVGSNKRGICEVTKDLPHSSTSKHKRSNPSLEHKESSFLSPKCPRVSSAAVQLVTSTKSPSIEHNGNAGIADDMLVLPSYGTNMSAKRLASSHLSKVAKIAGKASNNKATLLASKVAKAASKTTRKMAAQAMELSQRKCEIVNRINQSLTVGSRILADWGDGFFYPGQVASFSSSTVNVTFADRSRGKVQRDRCLTTFRFQSGDDVMVRCMHSTDDYEPGNVVVANWGDSTYRIMLANNGILECPADHVILPIATVQGNSRNSLSSTFMSSKRNTKKANKSIPNSTKDNLDNLFSDFAFLITFSASEKVIKAKESTKSSIEKHGGIVIDRFDSPAARTRRLMCIADRNLRTRKYWEALCQHAPCVHFNWINKCISSGSSVDLNPFLLPIGISIGGNLVTCHDRFRNDTRVPIFHAKRFHVGGSLKFRSHIISVLRAGGVREIVSKLPQKRLLVEAADPKELLGVDYIVVEKLVDVSTELKHKASVGNIPIVSKDWIGFAIIDQLLPSMIC